MIAFAPTPRAEMERRAAEKEAARRAVSGAPIRPAVRNLRTILTLGDTTFFAFRGRPFGVPPLPWAVGEQLLDLYTRALDAARRMAEGASHGRTDREAMAEYFAAVRAIAPILWKHSRPATRGLRWLRRLGLMRNPFALATEREILEVADFFLSCRTRSGVTLPPPMDLPAPGTSSRNS